jgi:phosphoglucosamine mutase
MGANEDQHTNQTRTETLEQRRRSHALQDFRCRRIRGTTNTFPVTAEMALRLGMAAGAHFRTAGKNGQRVLIGKDTRHSGSMIENALTAGLTSMGMDVILLGEAPAPAVGYLVQAMRGDLGIMISAGHNQPNDNGIRFFGPEGFQLSDPDETEIERLVRRKVSLASPQEIGHSRKSYDASSRYVGHAKATLQKGTRLDGLRVVLDCANGAAFKVAPETLWELGAEVIALGVSPDGSNVNVECGANHPEACAAKVLETGANLGITLSGDATRVILVDERGQIADADQIMGLLATSWSKEGKLRGGAVVATVMSNSGLERYLANGGLWLERVPVGTSHVVEHMRTGGYNLGGEQSGHFVMTNYGKQSDGLIAALQFMAVMVENGRKASELSHVFEPVPQVLRNVICPHGIDVLVRRRMIWDSRADLGAEVIGSSGSGYAA